MFWTASRRIGRLLTSATVQPRTLSGLIVPKTRLAAPAKGKEGLQSAIQQLYTKFDKDPSTTCAKLLTTTDTAASSIVRSILGLTIKESAIRSFIAPIVHRLQRCAAKDVDVLSHFITRYGSDILPADEAREERTRSVRSVRRSRPMTSWLLCSAA